MYCPAIIVVGFSRLASLTRLLESINNAFYPDSVNLIISLDGGGCKEVVKYAKKFKFRHGNCKVIEHSQNFGLRNHILWCGDQSEKYESVIILEDDLLVDPYFYFYASEALNFYDQEDRVAGIALYSFKCNPYVNLPFEPLYNGYDAYPMAIACSWGQAWSVKQWQNFKKWYGDGAEKKVGECNILPDVVKSWPESSWLKYYSAYVAINKLYFIYPYQSFTTNFSDYGGVHILEGTNFFQVPLPSPYRKKKKFLFPKIGQQEIFYDSFMQQEPQFFSKYLDIDYTMLVVDLYGIKQKHIYDQKKIALTILETSEQMLSFALQCKPIELNIVYSCFGEGINLSRVDNLRYNNNYSKIDYWSNIDIFSSRNALFFLKKIPFKMLLRVKRKILNRKRF